MPLNKSSGKRFTRIFLHPTLTYGYTKSILNIQKRCTQSQIKSKSNLRSYCSVCEQAVSLALFKHLPIASRHPLVNK